MLNGMTTTRTMSQLLLCGCLLILLLMPGSARAFCFEAAGSTSGVEPALLWAIARVESNFNPDQVSRNADGSLDIGLMQINSRWQQSLDPATWNQLFDPCTNVRVAAGILAGCIDRYGYTWRGIGCYNAVSEPKQARYARKVLGILQQLQRRQASTP